MDYKETAKRIANLCDFWCAKTLSHVEVNQNRYWGSLQGEFHGTAKMLRGFGPYDKIITGRLMVVGDNFVCNSTLQNFTWYDARKNNPSRTEYRLLHHNNPIVGSGREGDAIYYFMYKGKLLVLIVNKRSDMYNAMADMFDSNKMLKIDENKRLAYNSMAAWNVLEMISYYFKEDNKKI